MYQIIKNERTILFHDGRVSSVPHTAQKIIYGYLLSSLYGDAEQYIINYIIFTNALHANQHIYTAGYIIKIYNRLLSKHDNDTFHILTENKYDFIKNIPYNFTNSNIMIEFSERWTNKQYYILDLENLFHSERSIDLCHAIRQGNPPSG